MQINTTHRHAFTLLELMIAIGLGMLIVFTATAAVRVAAQSVTKANRMSLENAILRAGFQSVHRDLDFWTNVDNPDMPNEQRLRLGMVDKGLPFTPFSVSWPGAIADTEDAVGYDPRAWAWAMGNPRMWWRGNAAEKNNTDLRFGRYSIFANQEPNLGANELATIIVTDTDPDTDDIVCTYGGPVQVPHSWIYAQIHGLTNALGYYGLCDYLPANALYAAYGPWVNGKTNLGGMPYWMVSPGGNFNNGDGGQQTARGKYRNSYQTSYAIIDPRYTNNNNNLYNDHRQRYHLGYGSNENNIKNFNKMSAVPLDLLAARPENWPGLETSVQRFIKNTRFVNMARVTWTDPISGETAELSFSGFGTTLRGARQQRHPKGGWAKWDNDGSVNDKTLDGIMMP